MAVFDRSWYGRVLVERVEGFATEEQWQRAYDEIVDFERTLAAEGMILVKFWMHISAEEQLRRFERAPGRPAEGLEADRRGLAQPREARRSTSAAVEDMLDRTDHPARALALVAADDKRYARVAVVETVNEAIEKGMRQCGLEPPPPLASDDG